jgi:hypothetical protein
VWKSGVLYRHFKVQVDGKGREFSSLFCLCLHKWSFAPPVFSSTDVCCVGLSWSDVLLGPLPNVYLYAANNPSESIIAKRRGYGTIVSHNVPPYGRAGG